MLQLLISVIIISDISSWNCWYQQLKLLISVIVNKTWFGPSYYSKFCTVEANYWQTRSTRGRFATAELLVSECYIVNALPLRPLFRLSVWSARELTSNFCIAHLRPDWQEVWVDCEQKKQRKNKFHPTFPQGVEGRIGVEKLWFWPVISKMIQWKTNKMWSVEWCRF